MVEWQVTRQSSVRVTPLLHLVLLLMYLHKIVSQNFWLLVMYISKSRQVLIIKLSIWNRVRFSILDQGFVLLLVFQIKVYSKHLWLWFSVSV